MILCAWCNDGYTGISGTMCPSCRIKWNQNPQQEPDKVSRRGVCGDCGVFTHLSEVVGLCHSCILKSRDMTNQPIAERVRSSDRIRLTLVYGTGQRRVVMGAEPLPDTRLSENRFRIFYNGEYYIIRKRKQQGDWKCSCADNRYRECDHLRSLELIANNNPEHTSVVVERREISDRPATLLENMTDMTRRRPRRARRGYDDSAEAWAERDRAIAQNQAAETRRPTLASPVIGDLDPVGSMLPNPPSEGRVSHDGRRDVFRVSWTPPSDTASRPTSYVVMTSNSTARIGEVTTTEIDVHRSLYFPDDWSTATFLVFTKNTTGLSNQPLSLRFERPEISGVVTTQATRPRYDSSVETGRMRPSIRATVPDPVHGVSTSMIGGSIRSLRIHFNHSMPREVDYYSFMDRNGNVITRSRTSPVVIELRQFQFEDGQPLIWIYANNSAGRSAGVRIHLPRQEDNVLRGPRDVSANISVQIDEPAIWEALESKPKPKIQQFGGKRKFASDDEEV